MTSTSRTYGHVMQFWSMFLWSRSGFGSFGGLDLLSVANLVEIFTNVMQFWSMFLYGSFFSL